MIEIIDYQHIYKLMSLLALVVTLTTMMVAMRGIKYKYYEMLIIVLVASMSFIVGARVLNYIVNYQNYTDAGTPIYHFEYEGFSLYGGLLTTVMVLALLLKYLKRNPWQFFDETIVPFTSGFVIMRLGCLFNGCCYGHYTELPFGIPLPPAKIRAIALFVGKTAANSLRVHPTQLYEIVGAIIILCFVGLMTRKVYWSGFRFLLYANFFTGMRLLVLFIRELPYESHIIYVFYPILYGCIILAFSLMIFTKKRAQKQA